MSRHLRPVLLVLAVGCLAIGGAVAANVALLGLVDQPHDRVGKLQLRLARSPAVQSPTAKNPTSALVVSVPSAPRADVEGGPDD
jgi:hypothetical protein